MHESVPDLLVPGEFNKDNARAAKAGVKKLLPDISEKIIDNSLRSYKGTWRRFEHKGTLPSGAELYDDYAHHPTAIKKTIEAAREKFPNKKIVVFFHPHLYSRTRDLFDDFATALALANETYILPVYAAREPFDPVATHEALAEAVNKNGGHAEGIADFTETTEKLRTLGPDTVAFTMGAGDVYRVGDEALRG
jgi:UDP-N-acetylmuramate--alanine ligase